MKEFTVREKKQTCIHKHQPYGVAIRPTHAQTDFSQSFLGTVAFNVIPFVQ